MGEAPLAGPEVGRHTWRSLLELRAAEFLALRQRLVGHRLPGGTFTVAGYERFCSHTAMLAPPLPDGTLHPTWILLGALRGMGCSLAELVGLAEADIDDGVLFGETILEQHHPLRADSLYQVTGQITDLTRRRGRRAGVMDKMTFELEIMADGQVQARSIQTFLIMRGEEV